MKPLRTLYSCLVLGGCACSVLASQQADLPPLAFVVQERLGNPDGIVRYHSRHVVSTWGCKIQRLDTPRTNAVPRTLYENPQAAILDMNLSWDARTLFFTMRVGEKDNWHLYEIGVDGTGFKQITSGPYHDFNVAELPDGNLVFASSRIKSFNMCAWELATALFSVRRDGTGYRQLTVNTLNEFSPQLLQNGQILYTRWEYVDRDVKWRQSLWTINPDGSDVKLYFGNTIRDPAVFWQARPIPGSARLVATFAPHHGWPLGAIGWIDRRHGVEGPRGKGYDWITSEYPSIFDNGGVVEWAYRDPFPLSADRFLVSYGGGKKGPNGRFALYTLSSSDALEKIWADPLLSCTYPLPLTPRPRPAIIPSRPWPPGVVTGTFVVQNIYRGLGDAVKPGEIKALRIMEQVPKFPQNETGEGRYRVYEMNPVMGQRSYHLKRCLGTVPVEADGSVHFTVPVFRELYFQALDGEGRAVQSMGSAVNLTPGETVSCVGCHDNRDATPQGDRPSALTRPPSPLTPYPWLTDGLMPYWKVVQPVLDRHCASCHSGLQPKAGLDLSGDKTRFFNMSYEHIFRRSLVSTIRLTANDAQVIPPKKSFGWISPLRAHIEGTAPKHETVRIPREERERLYLWMDSNANYYDTYARTRPQTCGDRDLWAGAWFTQRLDPLHRSACVSCHKPLGREQYADDSHVINLSAPEASLLLRAHLSVEQGGLGIAKEVKGKRPPLFLSKADPTYTVFLDAIKEGKRDMLATPRMDMPGALPVQGPQDWGLFRGTTDPAQPAPGHFWSQQNK
jgi:hypothetical protein